MCHVFISYAEEDHPIAVEIAQGLKGANYEPWYYKYGVIPVGASYLLRIIDEIERAKALVLVISRHCVKSEEVDKEVIHAHRLNKHFIPLLHKISLKKFHKRRPTWQFVLGASIVISIPSSGVSDILSDIIAGLKLKGIEPCPSIKPSAEELSLRQGINSALNLVSAYRGMCFRSIPRQRLDTQKDIVSSMVNKKASGKFNIENTHKVLYLSCDEQTCRLETEHYAKALKFNVAKILEPAIVKLEVKLSKVLDLTDSKVLKAIGISKSELAEPESKANQYLDKQEMITQTIGRLANESGFEAILVASSVARGKNLAIFPDNLLRSSSVSAVSNH